MPRLIPKGRRPDAPPLPLSLREVVPTYVVVRTQDLYVPEFRYTCEAGRPAPLSSRTVRRFVAERPELCEVGFQSVPVDPGWIQAFDEWATANEQAEEKRLKAEAEKRRREAEEARKREAAFLEQDRAHVEKTNRENAARYRRDEEEKRNRMRAGYERRAAELEAELEEAEA